MYEDFLPLVTKPARYINTEINAVHKDLREARTRVCLFFPDTYEVGMSHLGLRILYAILNNRPDTVCERVFSPWTDYEARLRASGRFLTSLESNLPLNRFDIIGVTLQYELSYTNIVAGLELAGIPLLSAERSDNDPVIIAGGPCAVNPEPLADFIDVFFIGEAEEAVHEIIEEKQKHPDRRLFLNALASRQGFYVPSLQPGVVRRRFLKEIESAHYPARPILPLLKPIHDRISVEVARGCIRGCRFCQAGIIYRPFRERTPERVKSILEESLACTGYEELSLASLSSGDYSAIQPLLLELLETYRESRTSVSLPSLRVGTLTPEMIRAIAATRKTGFTLAPEAGTERLRRVINKPVSDQDLMAAAETIFSSGWNVLKLYFMIGLPTETDDDLDGIIRLASDLLLLGKRFSKRPVQINISVSTFVPKPHTPFQWFGQAPLEEIRRKQAYLERGLRRRGISLKPHDPETSLLEGAFARGDRSLGRVILQAMRLGCRFDGWKECFDFSRWNEAFRSCGLDLSTAASRTYDLDGRLPWDHIESGVTKKFLQEEYLRATRAVITENCRTECSHCGMGCRNGGTGNLGRPEQSAAGRAPKDQLPGRLAVGPGVPSRIRVCFSKTGRLRFLSHLDLMTLFHRVAVRAGIPIAFSRGFNPHPRFAFGPALSVGIEGENEYLDLETESMVDLPGLADSLNAVLPRGIRILHARLIPRDAPSLSGSISRYAYIVQVPPQHAPGLATRIADLLARATVTITRDGKSKDIRAGIEAVRIEGNEQLLLLLQDADAVKPRVQDVLMQCLQISGEECALFRIKRTGMYYRDGDTWKDPLDL